MQEIEFSEYDRITDTIMWLGDNITLNFTVGLSRKSRNGDRMFFEYETQYGSDKYGSPMRSIKRQMSFAFTIDIRDNFLAGMMLRPQDVELLCRIIDIKVLPWYFGNSREQGFKIIEDKLILKEFEPATLVQDSRWISFQPEVATDPRTEMETRGVRVELYSGYVWVMTIDKFMGFYHILKHTDMYAIACAMVNYVKTPPYGTNIYVAQGLGISPTGSNNTVDDAWKQATNKHGFASNSFLEDSKGKEAKPVEKKKKK